MITHSRPQADTQPKIFKYSQNKRIGIQSVTLSRHGIGYVLRGKVHVYYGDNRHTISAGDVFFLTNGTHYLEYVPENGKPFEQIVFYYTPQQLGRILSHLSINYQMKIEYTAPVPGAGGTRELGHESCPAWGTIKNFFLTANHYIRENLFADDATAENIKMTELVYLILSQAGSIRNKLLENVDDLKDNFEQIIYRNIFNDVSIEELARFCGRSMTSFKKEFKRVFNEPPHRWFIQKRLMHSRLLLISTSRSIAEIGNECSFPNTSHYIKLFKKEFGVTPACYRAQYLNGAAEKLPDEQSAVMAM